MVGKKRKHVAERQEEEDGDESSSGSSDKSEDLPRRKRAKHAAAQKAQVRLSSSSASAESPSINCRHLPAAFRPFFFSSDFAHSNLYTIYFHSFNVKVSFCNICVSSWETQTGHAEN